MPKSAEEKRAYARERYRTTADVRRRQRERQSTPEVQSVRRAQNRESWLLNKYGIDSAGYARMLAEQGGVCAICRTAPEQGKHLDVDHCHSSGVIRGLLCRRCNVSLGQLEDDAALMRACADYVESAGRRHVSNG